jgi:hypothetical protein
VCIAFCDLPGEPVKSQNALGITAAGHDFC